MSESIESKTPPRPGIISPESFVFADRFKADSERSPKIAPQPTKNPVIDQIKIGPGKAWGNKNAKTLKAMTLVIEPPIKPAMLLLGLTIKIFRFFPKNTPKNHAKESFPNVIAKNESKSNVECSMLPNLIIKSVKSEG